MITINDDGRVIFEFFRPHAAEVHLVGSFNDWSIDQDPMQPTGDGWWRITADLEPGDYTFKYVADRSDWYADFAAHGVECDENGSWRSQLSIEAPRVENGSRPCLLKVVSRENGLLGPLPFDRRSRDAVPPTKRQPTKRAA